MRRITLIAFSLVTAAAAAIAAGPFMSNVETPEYRVERVDGPIEVRAYPSLNVAATTVAGSRGSAVNRGFRILANYIFGNNEATDKIEMTAPVMQTRRSPLDGQTGKGTTWTVRFVMPRAWPIESLPAPRDRRITLEMRPPTRFAVIRFSGFWRDALLRLKTGELETFIKRNGLTAKNSPIYAFYNPPWTLPFFRRTEVMIEVERLSATAGLGPAATP